MTPLGLFAVLLTLSGVFGILNQHTLRLPNTIGVLLISLLASLALLAIDPLLPGVDLKALSKQVLGTVDLPQTLLGTVLSFLLFAAAQQVDLTALRARWASVLALALVGTLLAVGLFGIAMWVVFPLVDERVPLVWCVVMGAILAPTDPVSVTAMLRRIGLPAELQALVAGESLFNDGVGVVVFGVALGVANGDGSAATTGAVIGRFALEALGGGLLGLALGFVALLMLRSTTDSHLELIISLALATGTFSLAVALQMSGPIAVVVAGLSMGGRRVRDSLTETSQAQLPTFWSLIDEVLNALLFLLIGFEALVVAFRPSHLVALLAAIPLSILVRALSVFLATLPVHLREAGRGGTLALLTWGGLRGGISVALALGLPGSPFRSALLTVCYGVVVFTIVVQGLTIERLARHFHPDAVVE